MAQRALGWHGIPYHQAFTLPWTGARGADPLEREGRPELLGCTQEMAERGSPGQPSGTAGETDSGRQGAFSGVHGGEWDGTRILLETPAPLLLTLEEPKDRAPRVAAPSVQDHQPWRERQAGGLLGEAWHRWGPWYPRRGCQALAAVRLPALAQGNQKEDQAAHAGYKLGGAQARGSRLSHKVVCSSHPRPGRSPRDGEGGGF